ncbi:hypothetical protein E3P89_03500 [Wallemia ichthyophaga]|uniref:chitin synthase n=1 Tax=Wallemia ichthyophaga TaxID=245174 RepID=A0A4T0H3I7_WALIC|nr:hypothetical protein E3P98_03518 [Wallemia ichthyophaga]TIB08451.1 hypothetical protein E3P93_03505 [Wallemia ichthyophaga]TIB08939.1 hypothetical protein E3P90_03482 [Wallemia ichthyophaga]TIB19995.1 hypothetical protein E3P89_03500 [Wallemia ichthyophaga]TIB21463.1 hypothetical protein E3P88_03496 [Wallemia ichthyophaga]
MSEITNLNSLIKVDSDGGVLCPNLDDIHALLQSRFRVDLPFTKLGSSTLISVNPLKQLQSYNAQSQIEYKQNTYLPSHSILQPHAYDLASRVLLSLKRKGVSQAVIYDGLTGSGKSYNKSLITNQLLFLSNNSLGSNQLIEKINSLHTIISSFGNAKTSLSSNATRHSLLHELQFSKAAKLIGSKSLLFNLDKSRIGHLAPDERSFHVFYQFLAGAPPNLQELYDLQDPSSYAMLASSGCFKLPFGPFSDDHAGYNALYDAFITLGFRQKHINSIWSVIVAILTLSNIEFIDTESRDSSATVLSTHELQLVAHLLGIEPDELEVLLVNRSFYVKKDISTHLLDSAGAVRQRDHLIQDLYAILFTYIIESGNHKLVNDKSALQILQLDIPGFNSKSPTNSIMSRHSYPLINSQTCNFNDFTINYSSELVNAYLMRRVFDDSNSYNGIQINDGLQFLDKYHDATTSDALHLLRGSPTFPTSHPPPGKPLGVLGLLNQSGRQIMSGALLENRADDAFIASLNNNFHSHKAYEFNPPGYGNPPTSQFTINHWGGSVSYEVHEFIHRDQDRLDPMIVSTLRSSSNSFISKLFSGPSISIKMHPVDEETIADSQISTAPLREVSSISHPVDGGLSQSTQHQLSSHDIHPVSTQLDSTYGGILNAFDKCQMWSVLSLRPNDSGSANAIDKRRLRWQLERLRVGDIVERRRSDYVSHYPFETFCTRYISGEAVDDPDIARVAAQTYLTENDFGEGLDYALGNECVWLSYAAWKILEDGIREGEHDYDYEEEEEDGRDSFGEAPKEMAVDPHSHSNTRASTNFVPMNAAVTPNTPQTPHDADGYAYPFPQSGYAPVDEHTPSYAKQEFADAQTPGLQYEWGSDKGETMSEKSDKSGADSFVAHRQHDVQKAPRSPSRRFWVKLVWAFTWFVPSLLLTHVGRMKRPDVRFAWREKLTLCMLIALFCGAVLFYIIGFGKVLCPNYNKAWSDGQLGSHASDDDFWVGIQGSVYDISDFWRTKHSDIESRPVTSEQMKQLGGRDLTDYFPPPLEWACEGLTDGDIPNYDPGSRLLAVPTADHSSGTEYELNEDSALQSSTWYPDNFLPKMKPMYKGLFVIQKEDVQEDGFKRDKQKAMYDGGVYDLSAYLSTVKYYSSTNDAVQFMDESVTDLFKEKAGQDITKELNEVLDGMDNTRADQHKQCLKRRYYLGDVDFRDTPRCQAQNYILLSFTVFLCCILLVKFLAALQLGSKRKPEPQDKFVICQVPAYTEGEDSLKKTIDSLAGLEYDDKRKLILVVCDGNIIGGGNDRTTPRIVLDIFGVDPEIDPEPLMLKSLGEGGKQMNYGKVYSGLYEYEGHVVPFMVVVKVGKPTERSRPGNRGKRDSQILVMRYLNRVHFSAPMYPLELEMMHQMKNVIGIDPSFYEYILMVDADTSVTPESLNRLVARCVDDSAIIGICGETRLDNEEQSWWTMIQVYEYFISHHLAKAFESLFSTVTCLPGCFSMYRIRTDDKGKPLIISTRVIEDYAENNVDTLHKKNLLSLGEDRYLTTIMLKYFSAFKMKFTQDAIAHTAAPESWSILMSQRRRWINSTVHNFTELINLPDICGFLCFSMRFIVIIDLISTILLPATVVYLVYLITIVALGQGPFPIITIIMLAATYGFQIVIFLLKREWQYVGWMIIYLLSYPLWSFYLPLYSFWHFDDFGWGTTRVVIGEKGSTKIVATDEEPFDESQLPLKTFSDYETELYTKTGGTNPFSDSRGMASTISDFQFPPPHASMHMGGGGGAMSAMNGMNARSNTPAYTNAGDMPRPYSTYSLATNNLAPNMPHMQNMPNNPYGAASAYNPTMSHMSMGMGMGMGMNPYQSMYGISEAQLLPHAQMHAHTQDQDNSPHSNSAASRPPSMFSGAGQAASDFGASVAPNPISDPSDEQIVLALRQYLATTPLMQVTKRTARDHVAKRFPNADVEARRDTINHSIDAILEGRI